MRVLLLIFIISMTKSLWSQTNTCNEFKIGTFYSMEDDRVYLIVRDNKHQYESSNFSNFKLKLKIKWIDNCTYQLKFDKVISNPDNEKYNKKLIVTTRIIETKSNSYIQESASNLSNFKMKSEIFKY